VIGSRSARVTAGRRRAGRLDDGGTFFAGLDAIFARASRTSPNAELEEYAGSAMGVGVADGNVPQNQGVSANQDTILVVADRECMSA
jgi:hypothetical protein